MTTDSLPIRVGELRPSQLMWAHGVGALVDLPHLAVVVQGLNQWNPNQCRPVTEPRLLAAVRRRVGSQVAELRAAPLPLVSDRPFDPFGDDARIGVPVTPFPEWLRCPMCGLLAPTRSRLFELKEERFRPDLVRYEHGNCNKGRHPTAVHSIPRRLPGRTSRRLPVALLRASGRVRVSWPVALLRARGIARTANLWVRCAECDAQRSMVEAFDREKPTLPACRGRHPQLDRFEADCTEHLRPILLGASNGWFPVTMAVLSVPGQVGRLDQLVEEHWGVLEHAATPEVLKAFRATGQLIAFSQFDDDELHAAVSRYRARLAGGGDSDVAVDLKTPEWEAFAIPGGGPQNADFKVTASEVPAGVPELDSVLLAERLREVNALIGFTRVEPPEDGAQTTGRNAPRSRRAVRLGCWRLKSAEKGCFSDSMCLTSQSGSPAARSRNEPSSSARVPSLARCPPVAA